MDFSNRRIIITGGAGHIGRQLATEIAHGGGRVAIVDRDEATACEVAASICDQVGRDQAVVSFAADLLDQSQTLAAMDRSAEALQGVDGLVHNAAFVGTSELQGWTVPLGQQSADTWRACLEVNLTVPFYVTQHLLDPLSQSGRGSVLMIGSIYGVGGPDQRLYDDTAMGANPAGYGASKGGLIQLTRYLATTMAPKVRVNCLSPGGLFRNQPEKFVARYESRTPLGRMATVDDVVGPAQFLLGDQSAYVTGQNLMVDGGWSAW
ncbi:NAD(P)-dependent dehydrogenase, short-chain alcohol dehydrogenase family [Neorhodopirellula lusitana]|uniref:NAD(P)-dependent dehydrogenase, short-chain alcohol dehydrogenase family n=1 Tax=Neorhodopirellula lusitana TaxID=445327 RepID=A0ABY1PTW4_9BACT|nr:SDR family oxidoreductase [Neorhodopirellula lusitana]SMP47696.1 NAD(P)-dependent dehydrogenase, short-chain alcohol dehydrogenase family [Neorhodopirellula lusitana]